MADSTPIREVKTDHGRVYQPKGYGRSVLDWTPAGPLAGHRTLTRGIVADQPTRESPGGEPVVRFAEKSGSKVICVRITPERGTLSELVRIAGEMDAEIGAERRAEEACREADHEARALADIAAFTATLPAGFVAIDDVDHNPGAADGWGMTSYRHEGVELAQSEVHELGPRYHHPLGNAYALDAYVPADALADLVARKRAEAAAKEEARAAKRMADEADRAAKMARARETGQPVELSRWTEPCDGSAVECSTDVLTRYAQPDGTVAVRRIHTH